MRNSGIKDDLICRVVKLYQIIARANDLGENPLSLSNRFCKEFQVDMAELNCLPPSVEPRVTDHIDQIIEMIQQVYGAYVLYSFCS